MNQLKDQLEQLKNEMYMLMHSDSNTQKAMQTHIDNEINRIQNDINISNNANMQSDIQQLKNISMSMYNNNLW